MPGNPALVMLAKFKGRMAPQALHALELQFGFSNKPMIEQYFQYMGNMLTGHFGLSFTYYPTPVSTVINNALPWTLGLVGVVWLISVVLGTFVGIWIAWRRSGFFDTILPPLTMFFQSIPGFWFAIVLVFYLAFQANWFPMSHAYGDSLAISFNWPFIGSVIYHAILPGLVIFFGGISGWIVAMRTRSSTC